jgi:hypothetical protein
MRSTWREVGKVSRAKECDGEDGLPTIIEVVGDIAWGTSMLEGSVTC